MGLKEKARVKLLEVRVYELEYRNKALIKTLEKIIKIIVEAGLCKAWELAQG